MGMTKYAGLTRKKNKRVVWNGKIIEDRDSLAIPYRWKKPRKVFVNSMSDLFHEQVSDSFIQDVWKVMRETPHHNYQILTKRPERMKQILQDTIREVLPNVWLRTSIECADTAYRVLHIKETLPISVSFPSSR